MPDLTSNLLRAALPNWQGAIQVNGLEDEVNILRCTNGIPHAKASSAHDAFFAQGFYTAQDRLWQMETDRRRAYGQLSTLLGKQAVDGDVLMRRFDIEKVVQTHWQNLQKPTQSMLEAYSAGVNAFVESDAPLPAELQMLEETVASWRPHDSLAVFMVRHILMGVGENKIWRARLLQWIGPDKLAALCAGGVMSEQLVMVPPGQMAPLLQEDGLEVFQQQLDELTFMRHGVDDGSNNWVVGGERTHSGMPLLAGDPHRALDVPNVYYQNHLACPEFNIIGFSFAGVPGFPHFAHNERVAWGITHGNGDYQDLYIERFNHKGQYAYQGEWLEAEKSEQQILIRGELPRIIECWRTQHGPVIAGNPHAGHGLSFRYSAFEPNNTTFDAIRTMCEASNANQLEAAMKSWVDPANNLVYADKDGAFGYRTRGHIPIRAAANRWLPAPGWDGAHEWQGTVAFDEMPAVRNPACGYVVTANQRITGPDYPHYIGLDFAPDFRARRIQTHLESATNLSVADMQAIQCDVVSIPAQHFYSIWSELTPQTLVGQQVAELLKNWNTHQMDADRAEPLCFTAFQMEAVQQILSTHFPSFVIKKLMAAKDRGSNGLIKRLQGRLTDLIEHNDTSLLAKGMDWNTLLTKALDQSAGSLQQWLGEDPKHWRWGKVHHTAAQHLLSPNHPELATALDYPSIVMSGDGDTVQAGGYYPQQDGYKSRFISVAKYCFDLADWENCSWIVPSGSSGHPSSAHYADQAVLYEANQMLPMTYQWDRVVAQTAHQQQLIPT